MWMQYAISKTIKKKLSPEQVVESLREKLRTAGIATGANGGLAITGFNRNMGGINYVATARFTVKPKEGKTVITADVQQRPSVPFFILLALTALRDCPIRGWDCV
jgi:cell division ATPase FtsA